VKPLPFDTPGLFMSLNQLSMQTLSRCALSITLLALPFTSMAQVANNNGAYGSLGTAPLVAPATSNPLGANNPIQVNNSVLGNLQSPRPTTSQDFQPTDAAQPRASHRMTGPNQFQRFVQDTTGRLLPIFGQDLFESPQAYSANTAVPAPDNYILGPGDEVQLQVSGPQDFNTTLVLDRNGQVNLPKLGAITLAGVAARDLEKTLSTQLGKMFTNISVSASLGRLRGIQVYVVGQAQQPGTVQLSSLSTLVNALFASGGPGANGSMRAIELKRGGKTLTTLDLYDFIAKGDKSRDLPLMSGDVIVIPPVGPRVAITGAFDQAAIYELKPGTSSVGDILNLGGGVPTLAKPKKALLERIDPNSNLPRQIQEIALDAAGLQTSMRDGDVLTLLDMSPGFSNAVTLQGVVANPVRHAWFQGMRILDLIPDRDALITSDYYKRKNMLVQKVEPYTAFGQTNPNAPTSPNAQVAPSGSNLGPNFNRDGNGFNSAGNLNSSSMNQGFASLSPATRNNNSGSLGQSDATSNQNNSDTFVNTKEAGTRIDDRIRGMVDQINWEYAVIERLDRDKLSNQLIPFNLAKAILQKDPAHNLLLQAGDVVTILSQSDLRLPQERQSRLVRVEGEVAAPGVYQTTPGETLPQLIKRIGGLTPQAYVYGTELSRESIKTRQQENLDKLIRRMEAQSQAQQGSLVANRNTAGTADQTTAILQLQQTQLKSQIERLKTMKSNGRMALELDPHSQSLAALPALPLEDGDRILIPSTPGFVSAFGSVNNENVFIYKPGKTVGDVIKSAGLTEDADPEQAFVLRADGSIISRSDRSGWFGSNFESVTMMPGDTLVVPAQMDRETRYNTFMRGLKDWTQILANFGLGIAAINSL